jgi:hypothetical protein
MRYVNEERGDQIEAQSENDRNADHEGLAVIHPCTEGYPSQCVASIGLPSIEMMALVPILTASWI